jgi:hypothetical protein
VVTSPRFGCVHHGTVIVFAWMEVGAGPATARRRPSGYRK